MDLDEYFALVKGNENKPCVITFKDGRVEEGAYIAESPNISNLGMVIRPMGKTRETYENVGISDPDPKFELGDTLEVKNLSLSISAINSIEFRY